MLYPEKKYRHLLKAWAVCMPAIDWYPCKKKPEQTRVARLQCVMNLASTRGGIVNMSDAVCETKESYTCGAMAVTLCPGIWACDERDV